MKLHEWDNLAISARSFCAQERDKTKENWFLYELSNAIYDELAHGESISEKCTEQELLVLSLRLSLCAKDAVEDSLRKGEDPKVTERDMQDKLAQTAKCEKEVTKIATYVINSLLSTCLDCPTRCIYDWKGKCYMFDTGP